MKKRDLFSKTRRDIICVSMGVIIISLVSFAVMTELLYRSRLYKNIDQQLQMQKNMIIRDPSIIKKKGQGEEVVIPAPLTTDLLSYVWRGEVLEDESPHIYKGEASYPNFEGEKMGEIFTLKDGAYHYRAVQFEKQGLLVQLLINVDEELGTVIELRQVLATTFLILLVIAFALASYLARISLRPLRLSYQKQVAFIQDASHEMRTPLAIIKGKLELLARNNKDVISMHFEEIASMMSELRGLEKLNSDLLLMSKEDVATEVAVTTFEVRQLLQEIYDFYGDYAELQEKEMKLEGVEEAVEVAWDYEKVKKCLVILVENALKYTEAGGQVTLGMKKQDKGVMIWVSDTGIGIEEEEQKHIFDRFYRSSKVRALGIEGSGIGLSLLKSIAHTLGIKIKLKSVYGVGTTFELRLPFRL